MLVRAGRVVPGFALGASSYALSASPTTFAQASIDLQNQVVAVVNAADVYYGENVQNLYLDFSDATLAYQAAGQAGATSLGPEIDAAGAPTVTQPFTKKAWTLNGQLASLPKSGLPDPKNDVASPYFTRADADRAKVLVTQMVDLYDQAIKQGSATVSPAPGPVVVPPATPATPTSQAASNLLPVVAVGAALAVVAAAYVVTRSHRRSHVPA